MWWSSRSKTIVLLTLLNILVRCSQKLLNSARKNNFLGLPIGVLIKTHFSLKSPIIILFKLLFKFFVDKPLSSTSKKRDVSLANSLGFNNNFSGKFFTYIKEVMYNTMNSYCKYTSIPKSYFYKINILILPINTEENYLKYSIHFTSIFDYQPL